MVTFLTTEDFVVPPYDLPPLKPLLASFNAFCVNEQETILRKLLGTLLYDQLEAGLDALPATYVSTTDYAVDAEVMNAARTKKYVSLQTPNLGHAVTETDYWEQVQDVWLDLAYGANYIVDTTTYRWVGMPKLLQPYIFYTWLLSREEIVTNAGSVKPKAENAEVATRGRKVVKANIAFITMVGDSCYHYYHIHRNKKNTLFGYLSSDPVTFVDWTFVMPAKLNALGI